jgi:hypothetical protein
MPKQPVLKEIKPIAGIPSVLYQPTTIPSMIGPPKNETAIGTIFCMNQGTENDTVSVALVTSGNVLSSESYIAYQSTLHYGHSLYLQQICINSNDSVVVTSNNGTSNFIFTGQITPI